jgi:hypothetical protein
MMLKRPARLHWVMLHLLLVEDNPADVLMVLEGIYEGAQHEGEEGQGNGKMSAPTILAARGRSLSNM